MGEVAFEITEASTFFFTVEEQGDNLVLTWESQSGQRFNVRSETDPSNGEPITWPIYGGHADLVAEPPFNTLIIPRPADPLRLFVIESFPPPPELFFEDDLDSGAPGWITSADGAAGTEWQLGAPSNVGPATAQSGTNCFGTNISADYEFNADVSLQSPNVDLTNATSATLCYYRWMSGDPSFDFLDVSVYDAADDSLIAELESGVTDTVQSWEKITVGLPLAAAGKVVYLVWRFTSDEFANSSGLYIDTVSVLGPPK
jgi:hypothetical protein